MSNKTDNAQTDRLEYVFGDFRLDPKHGALCRDGQVVPLRPKSWSVLLHLVRHHGELVSRTDLIEAVWHNASVSDDSISQCIVDIRRALDDTDHTKIRTVPRRGFVFEMPVAEIHTAPDIVEALKEAPARAAPWLWGAGATLLVAIVFGLWTYSPAEDDARSSVNTTVTPSIAVLAFTDMTEAGDRQYFGNGVAEEILNHLSMIPELRVISRSSSFAFRDDEQHIPVIAERLGVDFVLEGSVRGSADQLRITAQLIDARTNAHVWADSYDREVSVDNLVSVQNDIASNVAAVIGVRTGALISLPPEQDSSVDPAAMDKYLRGIFYANRINTGMPGKEDFEAAIELMQAAVEIDPDWAPPHAAIGRMLHFLATSPYVEQDEIDDTFEQSREYLLEALRLDPSHGPAYGSLAFIAHSHDLDFERAEALYARANALGYRPLWGQAIMYRAQGRFDEAIDHYRQAVIKNPLGFGVAWQYADALRCGERFEEAAQQIDSLLEIYPEAVGLWELRALASAAMGETENAREIAERYADTQFRKSFAFAYALLGQTKDAEAILAELDDSDRLIPHEYTRLAVALGQQDRAIDYLQRVAESQPQMLAHVQCRSDIGTLAGDPRFRSLLTNVGIPVRVASARR